MDRIGTALLASTGNGKDAFGAEGAAENVLMDGEGEGADGDGVAVDDNEEEEEEGEINLMETAELTDLEVRINNNRSYHGLNDVNTQIHCCTKCNQRMLQFAVQAHCHETHTVHAETEEGEAGCGQKKISRAALTRSRRLRSRRRHGLMVARWRVWVRMNKIIITRKFATFRQFSIS